MAGKHVVIIQGHPDPAGGRLCHALADAYDKGATNAGHSVERIEVAQLDFPMLRSQQEWERGEAGAPAALLPALTACRAADHWVLIYPLWLGTMPALLKAFLEHIFRPGVALTEGDNFPRPLFKGKTARVVITMGMPAAAYRWFFRAHSLKSLERNILKLSGIKPVRETLLGLVDAANEKKRKDWLTTMGEVGFQAR